MTETRYAIVESKRGDCTVEATFDNYPQAHAAAREFAKEVASHNDAELDDVVVGDYHVTFENHDYEATLTEIDAYERGETL
jgi:hypothetical protein